MIVYGIPNCDTVKRARAWLIAQGVDHDFHDFKQAGVPASALDAWIAALGWQALVNMRGSTWRKLDATAQRAVIDAESTRALLRALPSVVKRPVVQWPDGEVSVGFDASAWAARIQRDGAR